MDVKDSKVFTDEREAGGIEARELLPCPFCGGAAFAYKAPMSGSGFVECTKCTAAVSGDNKADAIAKWNRRV